MQIRPLALDGPLLVVPTVHADDRGYFFETFRAESFNAATQGVLDFVQENQSMSRAKGTVRGLHYQSPPHAQGKLVRCVAGAIVNIIVDARKTSSTFGDHILVPLNAQNHHQLFVPVGFLNGFVTQADNSIVHYKVTDYYNKDADGSVAWNSPSLDIDWGVDANSATLSDKDRKAPQFSDWDSPF